MRLSRNTADRFLADTSSIGRMKRGHFAISGSSSRHDQTARRPRPHALHRRHRGDGAACRRTGQRTARPRRPRRRRPILITYTGQLLDYRANYVTFTTGDAFAAVDAPRIINALTGRPDIGVRPQAKMFAQATLDPGTKKSSSWRSPPTALHTMESLDARARYVSVASTPAPAPELVGPNPTPKQVAVIFEVQSPTTNLTDSIYISTDTSNLEPDSDQARPRQRVQVPRLFVGHKDQRTG